MHLRRGPDRNSEHAIPPPPSFARATLNLWGVRGTCPVPGFTTLRYGGNTSCVEVQLASGARVILDAGSGLRAFGVGRQQAGALHAEGAQTHGAQTQEAESPDASGDLTVLLTHRHSDHVMGLAHFLPALAHPRRARIACAGVSTHDLGALVIQQLSAPLFPTIDGLADTYRVEAFSEHGAFPTYALGGDCVVQALPAHHPGGASVLRVDDAGGPVLAYAPDNELALWSDASALVSWRQVLCDALRGIPLLVHDATYTDAELVAHRGWGHSSAEEATRFAMACGAGALLLTHHHPERSDDAVEEIVQRCRAIASDSGMRLDAARERVVVVVE